MATVKFNGKQYPVLDYKEVGANKECFFIFNGKIFYRNGDSVTPFFDPKYCSLSKTKELIADMSITKERITAIKNRQAENAKTMSR